ncbi:Prolyl-tRNA synthetase associated domain-containing protein 1, partial [Cucurbita argyrosperma subsp. argyrosperma]
MAKEVYTREELLALLQDLQIDFAKYEHPAVMTVEAQAKYVGNLGGGISKNLFLKDKKNRYYVVSALAQTKVDLKVLSARLGLGKGGLRMAPEEALGEKLKVSLGCVTPFALINKTARDVALLLDHGFKSQEFCFFHPLSNETSISLNTTNLDKFLKSIGRDPSYIDLEANPSVGKDQPPDLAGLVPSGSAFVPDTPEKTSSCPGSNENQGVADKKSKAAAVKPSSAVKAGKDKAVPKARPSYANVEKFVEEILDKTSAIVLSELTEETVKKHGEQLGDVVSNSIKKHLSSELNNLSMIFKNNAYTEGFHAGSSHKVKHAC